MTVSERIKAELPPEIAFKALRNLHSRYHSLNAPSLYEILRLFNWQESPEGGQFWAKIVYELWFGDAEQERHGISNSPMLGEEY